VIQKGDDLRQLPEFDLEQVATFDMGEHETAG
jgi:hypothetical protein